MFRSVFAPLFACAALLFAVSIPAQAQEDDLVRPEGWQVRFDNPEASEEDLETFVSMPPGWHVTSGPAAIYWGPDMEASGEYRIEMEVYLFDPAGRREAFGMFVGGEDLTGDDVEYAYFLLRDGGEFIVKRREGPEAPTIHPWTGHDAILGWADREEDAASVKNVLAIEAGAEMAHFFVNDEEVAALPRADLGMDGVFGMRVNHALNLHVSRLETVKMGMKRDHDGDRDGRDYKKKREKKGEDGKKHDRKKRDRKKRGHKGDDHKKKGDHKKHEHDAHHDEDHEHDAHDHEGHDHEGRDHDEHEHDARYHEEHDREDGGDHDEENDKAGEDDEENG